METSINGRRADWTPEIWALWHTYVTEADPKLYAEGSLPWAANYFTPRSYVDEYNRGSHETGFVFTVGRDVHQLIIAREARPSC